MDPYPEQSPQPSQNEPTPVPTPEPTQPFSPVAEPAPAQQPPYEAAAPQPQPPQQQQPNPPLQPGVAQQQVMMVENPGQTLAIIGIVLDVLGIGIGGIILGVMARKRSRAAGMSTTLGTVSMVYGIVISALAVIWLAFVLFLIVLSANSPQTQTQTQTPTPTSSATDSTSTLPAPTLSQ